MNGVSYRPLCYSDVHICDNIHWILAVFPSIITVLSLKWARGFTMSSSDTKYLLAIETGIFMFISQIPCFFPHQRLLQLLSTERIEQNVSDTPLAVVISRRIPSFTQFHTKKATKAFSNYSPYFRNRDAPRHYRARSHRMVYSGRNEYHCFRGLHHNSQSRRGSH